MPDKPHECCFCDARFGLEEELYQHLCRKHRTLRTNYGDASANNYQPGTYCWCWCGAVMNRAHFEMHGGLAQHVLDICFFKEEPEIPF